MGDAAKKERNKNLEGFYRMLSIPLVLSLVNSAFFKLTLDVLGGQGAGGSLTKLSVSSGGVGVNIGFTFGVMTLLVYLWGRPASKYAADPAPEHRAALRRRLANIYRDAFFMLVIVQAVSLGVALFGPRGISWQELAAAGAALLATAALLVVYIDNNLAKQKRLMESLYSAEELSALRPSFSIPIHTKISLMVAGFAVLPFVLVAVAAYYRLPWEGFRLDLFFVLALSAAMLLNALSGIYNGIQLPLRGLIARMERVARGDYGHSRIYFSDEVARLKAGFNGMVDGLRDRDERLGSALDKASRLESELAVARATADLAAQVAHDIRSPLAALGAAAKTLEMPAEQRRLVGETVERLRGIADDLLERYRAPGARAGGAVACDLAALAEAAVEEKRLQFADRPGVKIEFSRAGEARAAVEPKEFRRALSNLLNNAAEALDGGGTVSLSVAARGAKVLIQVRDEGKGIPPEVLAQLGARGATHGKAGGTGLGLYQARTEAESRGGTLKIISEPGKGTTVSIELPSAAPAAGPVALLDNDLLVHMTWRAAARAAGADLRLFRTPEEFLAALPGLQKSTTIYIDSDLGAGVRGEDIALDLHAKGYTDLNMATGHGAERFAALPWLKVAGKEPPWS